MTQNTLRDLKRYGFATGPATVLDHAEVLELEQLVDRLLEDESIVDVKTANSPLIDHLPGMDQRIDALLEKMVSDDGVQGVLTQALGPDYKLWAAGVRRSHIGDPGLYVHQDAPGQMNLALLLSDNPRGVGATAFLPRSHKLPRWASRISWSNVRVALPWLTPFKGALGTTGFFFNRTWHARLRNGSSSVHDIILMGFFAAGGTYTPYEPSKEDLARWHGWELGRLLDPSVGTRPAHDGRVLVLAADGTEGGSSYAMSLEKGEWEDRDWRVPLLWVEVLLLEAAFRPLRLMRRTIGALLSIRGRKT